MYATCVVYRKNMVMIHNSLCSDWLVVVKSVSVGIRVYSIDVSPTVSLSTDKLNVLHECVVQMNK